MITEIYLFCRFTDNLVDKGGEMLTQTYQTLDLWHQITYSAYQGTTTGIPIVDVVMSQMAENNIPFRLVSELMRGCGWILSLESTSRWMTYGRIPTGWPP